MNYKYANFVSVNIYDNFFFDPRVLFIFEYCSSVRKDRLIQMGEKRSNKKTERGRRLHSSQIS